MNKIRVLKDIKSQIQQNWKPTDKRGAVLRDIDRLIKVESVEQINLQPYIDRIADEVYTTGPSHALHLPIACIKVAKELDISSEYVFDFVEGNKSLIRDQFEPKLLSFFETSVGSVPELTIDPLETPRHSVKLANNILDRMENDRKNFDFGGFLGEYGNKGNGLLDGIVYPEIKPGIWAKHKATDTEWLVCADIGEGKFYCTIDGMEPGTYEQLYAAELKPCDPESSPTPNLQDKDA